MIGKERMELENAVFDAAKTVIEKWGNPIRTEFGEISGSESGNQINIREGWWSTEVGRWCDPNMDDLWRAKRVIETIVSYCAIEDFSNKVYGAAQCLRAITNAIESKMRKVSSEVKDVWWIRLGRRASTEAQKKYAERFDGEMYKRATEGLSGVAANVLIDDALALCGSPHYKLSRSEWDMPQIKFLELFL